MSVSGPQWSRMYYLPFSSSNLSLKCGTCTENTAAIRLDRYREYVMVFSVSMFRASLVPW
jgi:hypothetical protein